jgi:fumarate hydratase class II
MSDVRIAKVRVEFRIEEGTLGKVEVPPDRLWGAQTQRSHVDFVIGVERFQWRRPVIRAFGILKKCAALANGYREDITLRQAALELGHLTAGEFDGWVKPQDMTHPLER